MKKAQVDENKEGAEQVNQGEATGKGRSGSGRPVNPSVEHQHKAPPRVEAGLRSFLL